MCTDEKMKSTLLQLINGEISVEEVFENYTGAEDRNHILMHFIDDESISMIKEVLQQMQKNKCEISDEAFELAINMSDCADLLEDFKKAGVNLYKRLKNIEMPPLVFCSRQGKIIVVKKLLSLGVYENINRALIAAIEYNQQEIIDALLETGKINYEDDVIWEKALAKNDRELMAIIAEGRIIHFLKNDDLDRFKKTFATIAEDILVSLWPNNNKVGDIFLNQDEYGRNILHYSLSTFSPAVIAAFIDSGADFTACNQDNQTPFYKAAFRGKTSHFKVMLEKARKKFTDVNDLIDFLDQRDNLGESALTWLKFRGQLNLESCIFTDEEFEIISKAKLPLMEKPGVRRTL